MPPTLILIRHAQALHNATSDWVRTLPPNPHSLSHQLNGNTVDT
jgi:phosphohistidine phosphatase SixA